MKASTIKALDVLAHAGDRGATTGDFIRAGSGRFGARLLELKRLGYEIRRERVRDGQWLYTLLSSPPGLSDGGLQPVADSSGDHGLRLNDPTRPAPPASDRSLPTDAGQLFEMPIPGESPDADRWRDPDQRDAA